MVTRIAIAIDGTGAFSNKEYASTMQNSFVRRIYRACGSNSSFGAARSHYYRGPSASGVESGFIGVNAVGDYLRTLSGTTKSEPLEVYITGYSRGAMIAIYVAERIHQYNKLAGLLSSGASLIKSSLGYKTEDAAKITIPSMILFDPVDSDVTLSADTIPASVQRVDNFVCSETDSRFGRSRWWFNRINIRAADSAATKIQRHSYHCTHSAIGGLPGQGDHVVPASGRDILYAGAVQARESMAFGINPVAGFIAGSAGRAYDAMKSDITLKDDMESAGEILRALSTVLQERWKIMAI